LCWCFEADEVGSASLLFPCRLSLCWLGECFLLAFPRLAGFLLLSLFAVCGLFWVLLLLASQGFGLGRPRVFGDGCGLFWALAVGFPFSAAG
jgi:hypothetical protein